MPFANAPLPAPIESAEALREALVALHREHDALRIANDHANQLLEALDALLNVGLEDDAFASVFAALHKVFTFTHALALAEMRDGGMEAVVADPVHLAGSHWPVGAFFRKVMEGRVVTTFTNEGLEEWQNADLLGLASAQSALYAPLRVRNRRGILMLLRAPGEGGFDRTHVALARKFSVLASHALAARYATQSEAESASLRALTEQLQRSEQGAKRNADLLNEVVNLLPVGVTVQDEAGRFVLVNDAAAQLWQRPASELRGMAPYSLLPEDAARRMRQCVWTACTRGVSAARSRAFGSAEIR